MTDILTDTHSTILVWGTFGKGNTTTYVKSFSEKTDYFFQPPYIESSKILAMTIQTHLSPHQVLMIAKRKGSLLWVYVSSDSSILSSFSLTHVFSWLQNMRFKTHESYLTFCLCHLSLQLPLLLSPPKFASCGSLQSVNRK